MRIKAFEVDERTKEIKVWSWARIEKYVGLGWIVKNLNGYIYLIKE